MNKSTHLTDHLLVAVVVPAWVGLCDQRGALPREGLVRKDKVPAPQRILGRGNEAQRTTCLRSAD